MKLNPQNTAIVRFKSSKIANLVIKKFANCKSILDFGCGRGRDCQSYADAGFEVNGYDPFYRSNLPVNKFDIVTMTYVLNVITTPIDRAIAVKLAYSYVKPGGYLVVATRTCRDIERQAVKKSWQSYEDGYISSISRGTFQKGFTLDELKDFLISSIPLVDLELIVNEADTLCLTIQKDTR